METGHTPPLEPAAPPMQAIQPSATNGSGWMPALAAVLGLGFLVLCGWAVVRGDFMAEGAALIAMPWGRVTLADLYLGFVLYAALVWVVEGTLAQRLLWSVPVFLLGNVWPCLWIVVRWKQIKARLLDR